MFHGIRKPKFYSKCKSLIKLIRLRLESAKKKKQAVHKYLKNDVADLLKNGLDYNAYGRIEGLLDEKKRLSCYDFIQKFCICVTDNISVMQNQGDIPSECKEAISSLIYAAARVSEIPELRDLRSLFTQRYGCSLDQYINREFVERFQIEATTKETKLQLLQEVAHEFHIQWNPNSLQQKLFQPPTSTAKQQKNSKISNNNNDDNENIEPIAKANQDTIKEKDTLRPNPTSLMPPPYMKPKPEKDEDIPITSPKPKSVRRRKSTVSDEDCIVPPARAASVPVETHIKAEVNKGMSRADSFDMDNHVHPKMPDYDELSARVAALKQI